jgi:uncharacterized protein
MDLTPAHLEQIRRTLEEGLPEAKWRIFGSRSQGTNRPYSDVDILINTGRIIPMATMGEIREKFETSDLPFRVDLVDEHRVSREFLQQI